MAKSTNPSCQRVAHVSLFSVGTFRRDRLSSLSQTRSQQAAVQTLLLDRVAPCQPHRVFTRNRVLGVCHKAREVVVCDDVTAASQDQAQFI